jgi:hypothetical protein
VPAQITPPLELVEAARGLAESLDRFGAEARLHPGCLGFIAEALEKHQRDVAVLLKTLRGVVNSRD